MAGLADGSTRSQMSEQEATRVRSSLDKAYFVARCAVGEIANVNHVFQPNARLDAFIL